MKTEKQTATQLITLAGDLLNLTSRINQIADELLQLASILIQQERRTHV